MTKLEIIDETVAYYSADPSRRGIGEEGCEYLSTKGCMCAVGRCLIDPSKHAENECGASASAKAEWESDDELDEELKLEYRGHSRQFWTALQSLHDDDDNWTESGLSARGRTRVAELKADWADA